MATVFIPSAGRARKVHALAVCPTAVVVVPRHEWPEYRRHNPHVEISPLPEGHPTGVGASRQWIMDTFADDVFMLDDDISGVTAVNRPRFNRPLDPTDFLHLVDNLFTVAADLNLHLVALSDNANPKFFSPARPLRLTGN
ncbi:MAG: hypothetical protein ACRC7O_12310, partial [Fimbriiglobus sp.]